MADDYVTCDECSGTGTAHGNHRCTACSGVGQVPRS